MAVDAPPRQLTEIVQDILEVERWSGSASNRQFGEIIVIRKERYPAS